MPSHQQTMRIYAVRCTGDEGQVVVPGGDVERFRLIGQDGLDLVDLVGERALEHADEEDVALFHPVQVREQLGGRQPAMAGQRRVRAGPAHGQRRRVDVAHAHLERGLVGAVVDGQRLIQTRDGNVAHHAVAVEVEQLVVLLAQLRGRDGAGIRATIGSGDAGKPREPGVVGPRGIEHRLGVLVGQRVDGLLVSGDYARRVALDEEVRDGGVRHDGEPHQNHKQRKYVAQSLQSVSAQLR